MSPRKHSQSTPDGSRLALREPAQDSWYRTTVNRGFQATGTLMSRLVQNISLSIALKMLRFLVPPSDSVYPSRDSRFRRSFYQPLQKNPPRLTKEGYIRALELYGREDKLLDSLPSSAARFNQWKRDNPGDLAEYRRYANRRDYDWENGSVDKNSFYTSYIRDESPEVSQENLTAPLTMPRSQDQETGLDNVTEAPRVERSVGNMAWKDGKAEANTAGVAYIATAAMNALRHVVENGDTIEGRDLEIAQESVDYVSAENMEQFRIYLGNFVQGGNPSGGLRNRWLEEEEEVAPLPVQRRLFGEASTPSRKRQSSLFQELQAEDESEHEVAGRVRGNAREQSEMPYILEDCWEVAGESIPVSVLYANGQALPLRDTNVAKLLGRFHEAVIKEGQMNVTLAKSMNMLGIPAAAILRPGPAVAYLTGQRAIKALDASSKCSKLAQRSAARKLVMEAVGFYDKHGYTQISKRMPALFQFPGLPTYAESKTCTTKLTTNGQANFNAPNEKGDVPVHQVGPPSEGEDNGESSGDSSSDE
ncbi:hypothetical protein J3E68DRAFT_429144 [Trichoderma sp. SZMC 28012]